MFTPREKQQIIEGHLAEICSRKEIITTPEGEATYLDEIFSQAFSNADNLFDRVDLIDKFESGYPELLRVSNWYRSNLEQFSDQKREHDELTCILDKLRRSSPDNNFDWSKLAAQFRAILGPIETYSTPGPESGDELWYVKRSQEVKQPYETLAKRGLKALGFPGGSKGLEAWYSLLRLQSSLSKHRLDKHSYALKQFALVDRGKIEPLCMASADYCDSLAIKAYGDKSRDDALLTNINSSWERRFEALPLLRFETSLVARGQQRSLFPASSNYGRVRSSTSLMGRPEKSATRDLYPAKKGEDLTESVSALNPSQHRNRRIKEDSLAKIVSIQERLEAMVTQLAQQHEAMRPERVSKSYPKGFEGLPEKPPSYYIASALLTEMQLKCARLKWDYLLGDTQIARRLGKSRATIKEHLGAALKKIDSFRSSARRAKRIKTSPECNQ